MPPSPPAIGPDLRAALVAMVRKRVPESEVEDIVQTALAEAIESPHAPTDSESLRKWIFGVAKNKVADYHRRAGRESFDMPEVAGKPAPHVEADLLRWAEKNLPPGDDAQKTLDWMLREGEGEKLESIAESEHVPAPRVRQRVSRLRRHLKANWQREVALLAGLGVLISVAIFLYVKSREPEPIANDPRIVPLDPRAEEIRKGALEKCAAASYKECLEGLDEAKRIDPAGDTRPEIQRARQAADEALSAPPTNTNAPPPPTETAVPPRGSAAPLDTPPPVPTESKTAPVPSDLKGLTPFPSDPSGTTKPEAPPQEPQKEKGSAPSGKPTPTTGSGKNFDDSLGSFGSSGSTSAPMPKKAPTPTKPGGKADYNSK